MVRFGAKVFLPETMLAKFARRQSQQTKLGLRHICFILLRLSYDSFPMQIDAKKAFP